MNDSPLDAAWVIVDTTLPPARLAEFCRDLERLYRINPYLEFRYWRLAPHGAADAAWRNHSNGRDFELRLTPGPGSPESLAVYYDRGIKQSTRFEITPAPGGSRLKITDIYPAETSTGAPDTAEVDRSLHAWGVALRDYLRRDARWGRFAIWRWYMRRMWLPMKPAARRITFVILLVTLAELALFALVMAIYWIERR
jgi:hypothetical protein